MYDIVIIGAGPAGATLARLLDIKYRTLIVDKRNLSDDSDFIRSKCCGGLLAPAAQKALAKQGLGIPESILIGPQTFSVKSVDFDNNLTKYYQRHYININREKFDRWLVSLIPDSVDKMFNSIYKSYKEENNEYKIEIENNGTVVEIATKILIGTDGAVSRIREQAFIEEQQPRKYISIQEHFNVEEGLPYYVSVFDREVTDFYSWIIQKENELLVGTAIPNTINADEKYTILAKKLRERGYIAGKPLKRTGTVIMRPGNLKQLNFYKDRIALAGEAAGLISPSSAEGISYALESGKILASCINTWGNEFGVHYRHSVNSLKRNLLFKRFKVMLMYNKLIRKIIMKSGILSMRMHSDEQ